MTDDQRRRFDNLVLLCKPHHELVDKRHPERYPTETLLSWKEDREKGAPLSQLSDSNADDLERFVTTMYVDKEASIIAHGGAGGLAPGAGGGGGAGVGPGAKGGDGGAGGEIHHVNISDLAGLQSIDVEVGTGGTAGGPGGDSVLTGVLEDGSRVELARAAGGQTGDTGAPVKVRGTGFFADAFSVRDGLLHLISGLLTTWITNGPSIEFSSLFIFVAERRLASSEGVAALDFALLDSSGAASVTEKISIDFRDATASKCIAYINISAHLPTGSYLAVVSQDDLELSTSPVQVITSTPLVQ